jgi:hypothetical protein
MKPMTRSKGEVVDELRRHILGWKTVHRLTDEQVVCYMAMVASGYAEAAYVHLPHQAPPRARE